jgi:hypothetical protein
VGWGFRASRPPQLTTRRPKPPAGRAAPKWLLAAQRWAPRTRCGGNSSRAGPRYRPTARDFGSGTPRRIDFHHRAAVDHRSGEIGAVVDGDRRDGAVLRQRDRGFGGDPRLGRGAVNHEDQRLAGAVAQIDRGAHGAQIVRARAGRDYDQFGDLDHALDRHGDRRRRIEHRQAEALLPQHLQIGGEPRDRGLGEGWKFGLPLVPPVRQRTLRIDIDQHHGTGASPLRLHRQVPGQRGLSRTTFL